MTTYRNIHGRSIQAVTTDPTESVAEGQVWYNTTSDTFKSVIANKAFISSTPYPTAIFGNMGAGTQTAALSFGGTANPSTPSSPLVLTLEYNGSGWGTGGNMSQKRRSGFGFGTQTAALGSTGYTYPETNKTEHYNGTSWTNGGNYPVSQELGGGCGTQTAGLACGGGPGPSPVAISNEYDGSSWTASPGALNSARKGLTVTGIQTAGLAASAADSPTATACEEYNGSTWTTVNSMNTPRATTSFGSGIQTASILYGTPGSLESYDGTNWTNEPATMGNARNSGASAGTATASLASCGSPGAFTSHVEEYNVSVNVITAAAWSSSNALSTARQDAGGWGVQTAAAVVGGETPSITNATEEYDGTSWTGGGNYPSSRTGITAFGIQTAGVGFGGYVSPASTNVTAEYDGTSWTAGNNWPQASYGSGAAGTLTAGLGFGGDTNPASPRNSTTSAEYDGTNWTASPGSLGTGGYYIEGAGTQTAAAAAGGQNRGLLTEEYNGSSWTAGGVPLVSQSGMGLTHAGTQDSFITMGSTPSTFAQKYDGTSYTSSPSLGTGRTRGAGGGTATAGLYSGGREPSFSTKTEEFTAETTALNVKTLTQS